MRIYSSFTRKCAGRRAGFVWLPVLLGVFLVAAGFGIGYAVVTKQQAGRERSAAQPIASLPQVTTPEFSASPPPSEPPSPTPPPPPTPTQTPTPTLTPTPIPTPGTTRLPALGAISWHERRLIPDQHLWKYSYADEYMSATASYWSVGLFTDGTYSSSELVVAETPCEGPCFRSNIYFFVKADERFTMLKKYSDEIYSGDGLRQETFSTDDAYTIPELDFPKTLSQPGTRITMELDQYRRGWFDANGLEKAFVHPVFGNAYTDAPPHSTTSGSFVAKRNGIYFRGPDGMERVYALKPDMLTDGVPHLTWNDGTRNLKKYEYTDIGGCGARNYTSVVDPATVNPEKDLAARGLTLAGDAVYELQDANHPILKDVYEHQYYVYGAGAQKIPYAEFIARHPVFFWRDPLERLIKFQNADFVPLAECAKPVIYLYPERKTRLRVRIEPQGGLAHAEPPYNAGTGWIVDADPSGTFTDAVSGRQFPYLFWEGRGGLYEQPQKGFVVERGRVRAFLDDTLQRLGLAGREISDFIAYWEPQMRSAPYYFIAFLGTKEMDRLAPLSVEPRPDTVIRILMDFTPLAAPIPVDPALPRSPPRTGFTVIEWGGVRR